jgi:anti-sigma factor ChrR (cupin superfamily)
MGLSQDIRPLNSEMMDTLVRSGDLPWLVFEPGQAFLKLLWVGSETGRWAVLFRWKQGYVAPPHKHVSASHTFIFSGKLQIRDCVMQAGDYVYEPNGMLHDATTALEDTDYLFICDGPIVFYNDDGLTSYLGWEELVRLRDAQTGTAASH